MSRCARRLTALVSGSFAASIEGIVHRGMLGIGRPLLLVVLAASLLATALGGCSSTSAGNQHGGDASQRAYTSADVARNKEAAMPQYVTPDMRDAYQYALAHPAQLGYIPCYCGCGLTAAHKNNLDCYIGGVDQAGAVVWDNHASYCAICLEITRDVRRLSDEGKALGEIRAFVDLTHGEKGPGTDTPLPPSS